MATNQDFKVKSGLQIGTTINSVNGAAPTNGQLLIGNGSGMSVATLTQGGGVTITNGAGTITFGLAAVPNSALTNSSLTIGSTNIALGATSTTLAGLTSVTATTFTGALSGNATSATTAASATTATNLSGGSYAQSTGLQTAWGTTAGASTGAFNTLMGTGANATWLLSGTSSGVFRAGIQALDAGATIRFYQGATYFDFSSGVVGSTGGFAGPLTGNVTGHASLDLPLTGGTLTGALTLSADPSAALHAATKNYVDNMVNGIAWKHPADYASTVNVVIATGGLLTIDGTVQIAGNRVLLKNQTAPAENGVYIVAAGAWTRATDFDSLSPIDEINGAAVMVLNGATNADTSWVVSSNVTTLGTSAVTFIQFSGAGNVSAGTGLTLTGNVMSITSPSVTVGSTNIGLGGTSTTLAGLSSVTSTSFIGALTGHASLDLPLTGGSLSGDLSTSGTVTATVLSTVAAGPVILRSGGSANTGYIEFVSTASNRQGFIGYATSTAATDGGTIPFVMGTAAFSSNITAGGTITAPTFSGALSGTATNATQLGGVAAASYAQLANPTFTGTVTAPTFTSTTSGIGLRLKESTSATGIGAFVFSDTVNFHVLLTANNDANGTYNALRPFQITKATGAVAMGHGLTVTGGITGSLTGNADSATRLINTRTFAISGGVTGTASGFDGQANVTIPVTAVDASYLTGTVAAARLTGSYGISITGSAGSATTATTATNVTGAGTISTTAGDFTIVNLTSNAAAGAWHNRMGARNAAADKSIFVGTYGNSAVSTVAIVGAHNNALTAWADLYVNTTDGSNGGTVRLPTSTFISGSAAIHAGNYTSYVPSFTGTGASGTWGISITGSAASVSGYTPSTSATGNTLVLRDASGYTYGNYFNQSSGNNENGTTAQVMVTNGTDNFLRKSSVANLTSQLSGTAPISITGNSATTSQTTFGRVVTNAITQGSYGAITITGNTNGWAGINFSDYSATFMVHGTMSGVFRNNSSWDWAFTNGVLTYATVPGSQVTGTVPAATTATTATSAITASNAYAQLGTGRSGNFSTDFAAVSPHAVDWGQASAGGPTGTWWFQENMRHSNGSNLWGRQNAWGWEDNANEFYSRNVSGGTWTSWVRFLHSSNYNSYAPTLTGGGASGTWGISISGNAATATSATSASSATNATNATSVTGVAQTLGYSTSGVGVGYSGVGGPQVMGDTGNASMLSFHRAGAYAVNFGLDTDNILKVGGWSMGAAYVILHSGNYTSYAPSLGGSGASGTWGISITGNSASTSQTSFSSLTTTSGQILSANHLSCTAGEGNGLRFWNSDSYKISMGASAAYMYGPVTDYSLKMQMDASSTGRGFTWGREGVAPIAGLNSTSGNMSIAGAFVAGGDVTAFSDIRIKTNIEVIPDALAKVEQLRGVTFDRKDVPDQPRSTGVIAQELQAVLPEAVRETEDGMLTVAYGNTVGLLIEAIKELSAQNKVLLARIEALEGK
jgi:hypothetical protein